MSNRTVPAAAVGMAASLATLDDLLVAFVEQERARCRLARARDAAYDTIPEWAKPGPRLLMGDGSFSESWSGYPRVETMPEPSGGIVMRLIRPSIRDVWKHNTALIGPLLGTYVLPDGTVEKRLPSVEMRVHRRKVRLAAFEAVRKVIARIRRKRVEYEKAGVTQLKAAYSVATDRL